jgi:hypothetical protein
VRARGWSADSLPALNSPARPAPAQGGEEGGKTFGNDIIGLVSKNANFAILASAITKASALHCFLGLSALSSAVCRAARPRTASLRRAPRVPFCCAARA